MRYLQEIVGSLEKTFRPNYMPAVLTEFTVGREFDFETNFSNVVKLLVDKTYLFEKSRTLESLTKEKLLPNRPSAT